MPHISNVAAALIHINDPLISENRTVSDTVGMCLRSVLCTFGLPDNPFTSLSCVVCVCVCVCVCE